MPFEFAENGSEVSIDNMILKMKRNVAWMIIQGNGTIFEESVMIGLLQQQNQDIYLFIPFHAISCASVKGTSQHFVSKYQIKIKVQKKETK